MASRDLAGPSAVVAESKLNPMSSNPARMTISPEKIGPSGYSILLNRLDQE
jgi:hypothetical protein